MSNECDRGTFLASSLATSTGSGTVASTTESPAKPIPKRPLGKTGCQVTMGFCGESTGKPSHHRQAGEPDRETPVTDRPGAGANRWFSLIMEQRQSNHRGDRYG